MTFNGEKSYTCEKCKGEFLEGWSSEHIRELLSEIDWLRENIREFYFARDPEADKNLYEYFEKRGELGNSDG